MDPATESQLRESLHETFCGDLALHQVEGGTVISTPFRHPDGDGYPILLEQTTTGWRLTDRGQAATHLSYGRDWRWTNPKRDRLARIAAAGGARLDEWSIVMDIDGAPDADDVIAFIKIITMVGALPEVEEVKAGNEQFRTRQRRRVLGWLGPRALGEPGWHPQADQREAYPTDLRITMPDHSVLAFFAASTETAKDVALTLRTYRGWNINDPALVAVSAKVQSDTARAKLEDAVEDPRSIITVHGNDTTQMRAALRRLDVDLVP